MRNLDEQLRDWIFEERYNLSRAESEEEAAAIRERIAGLVETLDEYEGF